MDRASRPCRFDHCCRHFAAFTEQQVELQKTLPRSLPLKLVDKVRKDFHWHARKDAPTF